MKRRTKNFVEDILIVIGVFFILYLIYFFVFSKDNDLSLETATKETKVEVETKDSKLFDSENTDEYFKDMDIKLLGEMPMIPGISNISTKGYEDSSKEIDLIFKPILENIMKNIK